jgi:hypothetical protein
MRSSRARHGMPRYEKAKARAKERKRRSGGTFTTEENHVSSEELVNRALNRLHNLGNQKFAISPFSEHFGRWLTDLQVVLSEFESSPTISVDDQFAKERSQIVSNVEVKLEEIRQREASGEQAFKDLSNDKILLKRIEDEYTTKIKEVEGRKKSEIKRLSSKVDGLKDDLNRVARMKAGIFRSISKKAKAQKEAETTQRLSSAQAELALAAQRFTVEQEKLKEEHEKKKQPIIEQMQDCEKEVERQEIDGSLEARQVACEALASAVNALLGRNASSSSKIDSTTSL